ncbi:MAG: hypothetical protein Q8P50_13195 [Bacillota bacterium]|nr:hypothetical protein [Bacillota bacterium]
MAAVTDTWSERLTEGYLSLRAGNLAGAASAFALVALKAPPEVSRVARLEIRARFLEKVLSAGTDDRAVLAEDVLDACFPGLDPEGRDIVRQACKAILRDLEQEGRAIVLGPLFITRYAFQQKKLRLTGMLSQLERKAMEWGKALDFIVGNGKGSLMGKQEWRKVSRLLREGGALSCTSTRVQVASQPEPLDLMHDWMALTRRPVEIDTVLNQVTGIKGMLDKALFEQAASDERFCALGDFLWLKDFSGQLEDQWIRALKAARTALDVYRWSASNLPSAPDSRHWSYPKRFTDLVCMRLGEIAAGAGLSEIGRGAWADPGIFYDACAQHFGRLKKIEVTLAEIKEGLGLKGTRLSGRAIWNLALLLSDAGFQRLGPRFVHVQRLSAALWTLIEEGAPEPLAWQDACGALRKWHRADLTKDEMRKALEADGRLVCAQDGVFRKDRGASVTEIQQSVMTAIGEKGYASDSEIIGQVKSDWNKIANVGSVQQVLSTDQLFTRIHGGWALAPEFDWIADARAHLGASPAGDWSLGLVGRASDDQEPKLVSSVDRDQNSFAARSACFFVTGSDILNSRLQIYWETSGLFPAGRFVASIKGPLDVHVTVHGDGGAALVQFPHGFWESLGISHGDEVRMVSLGGWPPAYEIAPTGRHDESMGETGERIQTAFENAVAQCDPGLGAQVEAVLQAARVPMTACEIRDALALCRVHADRSQVATHLRDYSYFTRLAGGAYYLDEDRRRRYLLRIRDIEEQLRKTREDSRQAETMILAFRGENARLKNEARELRNRVSGLELERLKLVEAQQAAKTSLEKLNTQAKNVAGQHAAAVKKSSELEARVEELMAEARQLNMLLARPIWAKALDFLKTLFGVAPAQGRGAQRGAAAPRS